MLNPPPYPSVEAFFRAIEQRYAYLSKRLQAIARNLPAQRERIALTNVNELAESLNVAPSAVVRFAQTMGFRGYSQMKHLFQQELSDQLTTPEPAYNTRIEQLTNERRAADKHPDSSLVKEIIDNNISSLERLYSADLIDSLSQAANRLHQAESIWVMAAGRSFSAAAYFTYLIRHSDKPVHWLNGLCFNLDNQISAIREKDALLVISYAPYANASLKAVEVASSNGADIIAITDSHLNDIAKIADQSLAVGEHSSFGFRSLVNTVCVIQTLFLLYASKSELSRSEAQH